jgi:vitamin B12 transporter
MHQIKIFVLFTAVLTVVPLYVTWAQEDTTSQHIKTTDIEQVEITGYRNQTVFSESSRVISVIPGEELVKGGIQNLQDVLEYTSNIDVRQRGELGVQADVHIRGGSFDHVMILINGINLSDPQTGHASLDIPIDPESIDRIEILEGSAARILGAGAFTGAINIVTKRNSSDQASVNLIAGENGFARANLEATLNKKLFRHFISLGGSISNGYIPDTDFKMKNAFYRLNYGQHNTLLDFQAGFQDKRFGAAGFYSPRFLNQYEETGLWFASFRASTGDKVKISPSVYWRHRRDHYLLERDNPGFYENFHLTDVIGSQFNISWRMHRVTSTVGIDIRSENILSNNIGFDRPNPVPVRGYDSAYYTKQYGRTNLGYFQEHSFSAGNFRLSGGIMLNWNTAYPTRPSLFPGLDISYLILPGTSIYFSFNRALHLPTFTDLFYTDPVNQGNIRLNPNRMISYEGGLKLAWKHTTANVTIFGNSGKDIIDWLWSYSQNRFSPVNLTSFRSWGTEINMNFQFTGREAGPLRAFSVHYIYTDIRKSVTDSVSKYDHLRNKLSLMVRHELIKNIEAVWLISYQDRVGEMIAFNNKESSYYTVSNKPFWLLDGTVIWDLGHVFLFATISNLLNTNYTDAGSVNQPGRWFKAGISLKLGKSEKL